MSGIINAAPRLQELCLPLLQEHHICASVLRLDEVHPVISGNKWYKLQEYLAMAVREHKKALVTFGGAYSNHIVATAAACACIGLPSAGVIRGKAPPVLSPTLQQAKSLGMELYFVSREQYRNKMVPAELVARYGKTDYLLVPEGGYGVPGMQGVAALFSGLDLTAYSHLICAVGTGTTLAGLAMAAQPHQQPIGISVLKNNHSLDAAVKLLLPQNKHQQFHILHDFHGGGYANYTPALLQFMNGWYRQTGIPTDFVYTGKMFLAFTQLTASGFFPAGSNVLLVHSGGLQGNRSLAAGMLNF